MREIKFRAWNGKKMITPYCVRGGKPCIIQGSTTSDDVMTDEQGRNYYADWDKDVAVDYPLMQYTGLKDRNGVDIYEGDIVEWVSTYSSSSGKKHIDRVEWSEQCVCFFLMPFVHEPHAAEMKVLGNIHDNPELLESDK
jgi:uncharacterized phage protein (TIGR01671 family)